jgi:peptidoglycan/xylan/chitin deacetylase (PgdA/CDA1 family)
MLRLLARVLPVAALGVGSFIGLGDPTAAEVRARCVSLARWGVHGAPEAIAGASAESPPVPSVDPSLLPDPNPWPAINDDVSVGRAWLLAEGPFPVPGDGRRLVTLTFDDGPFPETTPVVLHVLEKHHVHATFFWIGRYLDGTSERAIRTRETAIAVRDAGHLIGTHTHDHERLIGISHSEVVAQIDRGMSSIERAVGVRPSVFRPPFGQLDPYGGSLARERGLTLVLWNVETQDLHHTDPEAMARNLEEQIDFAGGGVVLLHDIRFSTAVALDKLLTWLEQHRYDPANPSAIGYDVVDFAEFTRKTAASPQPFPTRAALEEARATAWRKQHPEGRLRAVTAVAASDEAPLAM